MNKKDFLKSLERKLSILDEQEVKDILNEYEDIIDEKVKDGKTEEEAVKEFGSIDELTTEILKTYKLNSKYTKENEPLKETINNFEDGIKTAANGLADFFNGLNNGNGISVELICELIIKFLILIVILAVLRFPFEIFSNIGRGIFDIALYPFNNILSAFWHVGMICLYFIVGALIFISLFKQYFNSNVKETKVKNNTKKDSKQQTKTDAKEEVKVEKKVVEKNNNSVLSSILSAIYKVFMVMVFLIPLWFINFGLSIALAITIYYTIIGVNIWGLIILFVGLLSCFGWLTSFFYGITFNTGKKISALSVFFGIVLTAVGVLAFSSNILSFDYINEPRKIDTKYDVYSREFDAVERQMKFKSYYDEEIEYVVDEKIEQGKMVVEIAYPSSVIEIDNVELEEINFNEENRFYIYINDSYVDSFKAFKKVYKTIIEDLKDGKVYNYSDESMMNITIKANTETMNLIK